MNRRFRAIAGVALASVLAGAVAAQPPAVIPLDDTRLPISTLVREDIFAGWMANDMKRFTRGEDNIRKLLVTRPNERSDLLAWQAGAVLFRSVQALESGRTDEYRGLHAQAIALLDEANSGKPGAAVAPITGGIFLLFGDRLPAADRADGWARAYKAYQALYAQQGTVLDRMPSHHRGEVMGGLVMAAQRTGRTAEANQYLDRMLVLVKDTPYEAAAKQWKADPKSQATVNLGCKNCHDAGTLEPTLKGLNKS